MPGGGGSFFQKSVIILIHIDREREREVYKFFKIFLVEVVCHSLRFTP